MKIVFDEVRRLTGPNLLWEHPGAIIDVLGEDIGNPALSAAWLKWSRVILDEFGWIDSQSIARVFSGGASLAISAPTDALYTACDLAELIWTCCDAELSGSPILDWHAALADVRSALTEEANPRLLELIERASAEECLALSDEDEFSLGAGASAQTWSVDSLPDPATVNWSQFSSIPIAYVTGTNGKSTSVRLAAEIALSAGLQAGLTSTDFIRVGASILGEGDYSGPSGARTLLRDNRCEIAFLEVARGGILRRGLPINKVDAALITNVASDHLGQYGIDTVDELAQVKFVVGKALNEHGVLVVNADNELTVNETKRFCEQQKVNLCWFSKDLNNPLIAAQVENGGRVVYVEGSMVVYRHGDQRTDVLTVTDIPMTFDGHAQHNVENVLGVVGLCVALGISFDAIRAGLKSFASDPSDNPGRGNLYKISGAQVVVDFAHNQHSMEAVVNLVENMPAKRRLVMFGHAGDRSDKDIMDVTDAVFKIRADYYLLCEYENYLRGRELGAIPVLMDSRLKELGVDDADIVRVNDSLSGAKWAMDNAQPGDVVLLFVLDNREAVHQFLSGLESS
ncbi:MAG TPA: Mur ligase [Gammaproteobacteria bacterium]|jgi:UDP-N-acetylmuramyl tripeptide synthase|nr:Mur ligase [Gammaproteobacteria bacterium]